MSNEFFLDTAYAIALSVESDEHHQRAEELLANQTPLVTTRAVLLEIGNDQKSAIVKRPVKP